MIFKTSLIAAALMLFTPNPGVYAQTVDSTVDSTVKQTVQKPSPPVVCERLPDNGEGIDRYDCGPLPEVGQHDQHHISGYYQTAQAPGFGNEYQSLPNNTTPTHTSSCIHHWSDGKLHVDCDDSKGGRVIIDGSTKVFPR